MPKKIVKTKSKKPVKTEDKEVKKVETKKVIKPITKTVPKINKKVALPTKKAQTDSDIFDLKNVLSVIAIIAILSFVAFFVNKIQSKSAVEPEKVAAVQTFSYDCPAGKNALDAFKDTATITTENSPAGIYVSSVNGIAEEDGSYWLYYINNEPGNISPDQYNCVEGDNIEWRLEKIM